MPFDSAVSSARQLTTPQDLLPRIERGDPTITEQEIFEAVAWHLRKQEVASVEWATEKCKYRGPNGRTCAAGALIPDSTYNRSFEGNCLSVVFENTGSRLQSLTGHLEILWCLQTAHDKDMPRQRGGPMDDVWQKLRKIAADRGLDASFIDAWELETA